MSLSLRKRGHLRGQKHFYLDWMVLCFWFLQRFYQWPASLLSYCKFVRFSSLAIFLMQLVPLNWEGASLFEYTQRTHFIFPTDWWFLPFFSCWVFSVLRHPYNLMEYSFSCLTHPFHSKAHLFKSLLLLWFYCKLLREGCYLKGHGPYYLYFTQHKENFLYILFLDKANTD